MKILLDTCTFLWIVTGDKTLSSHAAALFRNPQHQVFLSAVSMWEISVKYALGRLPLPTTPKLFVPQQREQHAIMALGLEEAVCYLHALPELHRDPFDRMLICQAIADGMTLLTPDVHIQQYAVKTAW